jgi:transcriptional regulator with XRE-family HTH domain
MLSKIAAMSNLLQQNLKRRLALKKLSVAELERRTGLRHAVINIMRGKSKNPGVQVAHALAKELGCTVEQLLVDASATSGTVGGQSAPPIPLDTALSAEVFALVQECIQAQRGAAIVSMQDLIHCWSEAYLYCYNSPTKTLDQRFIVWFMQRYFETKRAQSSST